jgi:hypothetical protein
MFHKSRYSFFLLFLLGVALVISLGCDVSDDNKKNSITSGTTTGSGSSGGAASNVTIFAASNSLAAGATTTITVIITDASGKRTDASIILTSSRGGTFNGSNATLVGNTVGGIFTADYKAPGASTEDEISAMVAGTVLKGTTIISISS